jgi:glycine cleavage system regulatory protein
MHMNRYQPSMPRTAIGLFATAMTAFTIALAVVVPANMDVSAQQERLLALSSGATAQAAQIVNGDAALHAKRQG